MSKQTPPWLQGRTNSCPPVRTQARSNLLWGHRRKAAAGDSKIVVERFRRNPRHTCTKAGKTFAPQVDKGWEDIPATVAERLERNSRRNCAKAGKKRGEWRTTNPRLLRTDGQRRLREQQTRRGDRIFKNYLMGRSPSAERSRFC